MEPMQREFYRAVMLGANSGSLLGAKSFREGNQKRAAQEHSVKKYLPLMFVALCLVYIVMGSQVAAAQTFQHPGVLVSKAQLDFIKAQV